MSIFFTLSSSHSVMTFGWGNRLGSYPVVQKLSPVLYIDCVAGEGGRLHFPTDAHGTPWCQELNEYQLHRHQASDTILWLWVLVIFKQKLKTKSILVFRWRYRDSNKLKGFLFHRDSNFTFRTIYHVYYQLPRILRGPWTITKKRRGLLCLLCSNGQEERKCNWFKGNLTFKAVWVPQ